MNVTLSETKNKEDIIVDKTDCNELNLLKFVLSLSQRNLQIVTQKNLRAIWLQIENNITPNLF